MKRILFIFLWTICLSFPTHAQNTEGTEFWLTFGAIINDIPSSMVDIQIRIVGGDKPTIGTIFFTNLGNDFSINFQIDPYETFNHFLTNTEKEAVYNINTGTNNHSARITSLIPVTVYAFIHFSQLGDATNVLPVNTLGTEYYQMSYMVGFSSNVEAYAVVATQNNTQLYHDNNYVTTLNTGQVYFRTSMSDMTGTYINADKPVAFFVLNKNTFIPLGGGFSSNLMQQLAPVNTWGKKFFVPVTVFEKEIVRIVVAHPGTNISKTGGTIRTDAGGQPLLTNLQPCQYVELEIFKSENGCFIEADKPIGVCSYMLKRDYTGMNSAPSLVWIPALEQTVQKARITPFLTTTSWQFSDHYALIVTPTATQNNTLVSVGNNPPTNLSGVIWHDHSKGFSFYSVPLTNFTASYTFSNPAGMIILGYGYGNYMISASKSYYYLTGSAMRDLEAAFYANDIHFQDLKENPICESEITFRAEIKGLHPTAAERIKWYVDGEHQSAGFNQETWSRNFSVGEYEIRMWVRYENNDTVSKTGTLKICSLAAAFFANEVHHEALSDTTFCNKTVYFRAETGALSTEAGHIRWYIDYNDGLGYVEELSGLDQTQWSKDFANGTYPVKMWVRFATGEEATVTSTLKVQAFWIKIRNVRY